MTNPIQDGKRKEEKPVKPKRVRTPFDPETMGFGKHEYRHIDPDTINPEDYAKNFRGDEEHFGDVREYNSAANEKHPENDTDLDNLSRIGTIFETEAEEFKGIWMIVQMPLIKAPSIYVRCGRIDEDQEPIEGTQTNIPIVELGCSVDESNFFKSVKTTLIKKGKVDKQQRERLTKK